MKEKRDEKENPKKRKERKMNRLLAVNYQIPLKKSDLVEEMKILSCRGLVNAISSATRRFVM